MPAAASFERLRAYLAARATLTEDELALILGQFTPRHLKKGAFLQRPGEAARPMAFVAKGCLRSYVVDASGRTHIVRFAVEDWWVADSTRFVPGERAEMFIDALEPSDLLVIDVAAHQRILDHVPGYAAAYRAGLQRFAAAKDQRIISALTGSARDRYLDFAARYPTLLARVPQRMLASYLGMSPETLSRIRRKLAAERRAIS